ncbi:MAG: chloride channel protein [Alphaproteobacteria bacterium]|nr:chloride channel protein [Alphaproteobacteria bacterium]|tara:strand:- start:1764 stop:3539 length:1776 start_codon:yes stop_codon:yes gene_type:complete
MTFQIPRLDAVVAQWRSFARNDQVVLSALALIIGAAVGYGTIGFRLLLGLIQEVFIGFSSHKVATLAAELEWWHVLLAPAAGGLFVGLFLKYLTPGGNAEGVAQVIEAGSLRGGKLTLRRGLAVATVSAASLGAGASAGREGPVVHLGATAASFVAQRFKFGPSLALTLLGCGVASAVAASFNAPIAGVFFALEVVIGHYALHAFAPIVIASVAGTIVSRVHLGDFPAFVLPDYSITSLFELPAFLLLGILCSVVAMIFMWSIMFATDTVERTPIPKWLRPAIGGLGVGLIAIFFPQVLGVGYEATDDALKGLIPFGFLILLVIAKVTATAITLGSGFGGGVFSPSLYIGAMTGGAFGYVAASAFPELASSPGLYAIVGMGAVAAPVLGAPISTVLMMFELIGDFSVTVAAMIAIAVASIVTHQILGQSFFAWQLNRQGVSLKGGRARQILLTVRARHIMGDDFRTIAENSSISHIRHLLRTAPHDHFFVTDADGHYVGKISFSDIRDVAFDMDVDTLINARDAARKVTVIEGNDNLERALWIMDAAGENHLPVVDNDRNRVVIGILHHNRALREYNKALLSAHAEEHDER